MEEKKPAPNQDLPKPIITPPAKPDQSLPTTKPEPKPNPIEPKPWDPKRRDEPTQLPYPPGSGPQVPTEPSHLPEPSRPATKPDDPILENEGPKRPEPKEKLRHGLPGDPFRPNPNPKPIPLPSPDWDVERDGPQPINPIANTGLIPREEIPTNLLRNKNWSPKEVIPQSTTAVVDPADYTAVSDAMRGRLESDIPLNDEYWVVLKNSKAKYYTTPIPPEPPPPEPEVEMSRTRVN